MDLSDSSASPDRNIIVLRLCKWMLTCEGSLDIFFNLSSVAHFIGYVHLFSRESLLVLIRYLFSFFILHLPLSFKDQFESVTNSLLVIDHIEMSISCISCFHEEVIDVECLIVGSEVAHAEADQRDEGAVAEKSFRISVH